jgi:decaprenylphospho-beta-D-erythro-pentofuranosid-2-ulose 2-reductase
MSTTQQTTDRPVRTPRKILVLGATSGIAEATCRIWATQGASLFLVARNAEKLAAVAADLRTRGASYVDTAVADLDDTDQHPALLAHAVNSLTGMDIAYLAHGILGDQAEAERDFNEAAQILYTNLMAPISLLTWLANFCVQRHAGTLAVLSSVAGDRGRKSNYVYGASKAGLSAFLAGLRQTRPHAHSDDYRYAEKREVRRCRFRCGVHRQCNREA